MKKISDFGMIGLAVMTENLALNNENHIMEVPLDKRFSKEYKLDE